MAQKYKTLRVILNSEFEDEELRRAEEIAHAMGVSVSNLLRRLLHAQNKRLGDNYDPQLFQPLKHKDSKLPSWKLLAPYFEREASVTEAVRAIADKYKCSENRVWSRLRKEKQNENYRPKSRD